jgi:uncharacterized protein YbjT (DUF2867 family)
MKKITVFGATGMLGAPVMKAMVEAGYEVKALVRDLSKARSRLPEAVRLTEGNLDDQRDVKSALEGAEAAYLSLSVAPDSRSTDFQPERDGLELVLDASKELGLSRIAFLSSVVHWYQGTGGFNWWVFDIKQMAVRQIKNSGIPYLIFYPSNFMEAIPNQFVVGNWLLVAGKPRHPNYWIAAEDYARQVANALKRVPAGQNREYVVQGKEGVRLDEAARVYKAHHRGLRILRLPLWPLKLAGNFSRRLHYGARIIEAINRYPETFQAENTWKELGEPLLSLADL